MKRLINLLGISILLLISFGAQALDPPKCFITGGGILISGDFFALNAMNMPNESTRGSVTLQTPYGYMFQSNNVDWLRCTRDGGDETGSPDAPQLARFSGTGRWNRQQGFTFVVFTEDRGEPTDLDFFSIFIFDSDEVVVYSTSGLLSSGNIQHLPGNDGHQ